MENLQALYKRTCSIESAQVTEDIDEAVELGTLLDKLSVITIFGRCTTLCKTCSSDKSSYPWYDIDFLKQNEVYFHIGYAILIDFSRFHNIKFEKTVS